MQHSQRLHRKLLILKEEVRIMAQETDRGELAWRERLLRCQRQLKAKEEEMSRQSQYFEDFKRQLQHKLAVSRDREENLQNRIYSLEKQLLELTVSAATGVATIGEVRITAGGHVEERERLLFLRGEGEGEEENKEERRKQWPPKIVAHQGNEQKDEIEGERSSKELHKCLLNLKADLKVLLEREESGMTTRRKMVEELQEAQENSHFLGCKVEEMEAEILQLKRTESSLLQEVEELRGENHRLTEKQSEVTNQTTDQSTAIPESTGPNPSSLSRGSAVCSVPSNTNLPHPPAGSAGRLVLDNKGQSTAVSHTRHQGAVKATRDELGLPLTSAESASPHSAKTDARFPASKSGFSLAVETVDDCKFGTWCSSGGLNMEEAPSEESDALREAYRSLGFGEDLQALQEQCDCLEVALQQAQAQLQVLSQQNAELKVQLGKQAIADEGEKPSGLVQALNEENRALAVRIQELVAHIELGDEALSRDQSQMKEHISTLEGDRARLELEIQEQGCLITELTKKTEDDLNTIMELQQRLHQSVKCVQETSGIRELCRSPCQSQCVLSAVPHRNIDDVIDILVESVINLDEEPQETTSSPKLSPQLHPDVLSEDKLSKSIQSLTEEEQELTNNIRSLREQEREVTLSVQAQAEEKQQLTRLVWGLKEEKDGVCKTLAGLTQEKEHLNRSVFGLKEQLKKCTSELEKEREKVLSSKSDEIDLIQTLQAEKEQLSHSVLSLKHEKDELVVSIQGLEEERRQFSVAQEGHNSLLNSLSSLKEEKEKLRDSISGLREEERRVEESLQGLKEQRKKQNAKHETTAQRADILKEIENATLRGLGNVSAEKGQSSSARETEALSAELKQSQKELDDAHNEVKKLLDEAQCLEEQRAEAERAAGDNWKTVADLTCRMEEMRSENDSLATQVKELQQNVSKLQREKAEVLTLQAQVEEKYNIAAAQLKAKSGALEQLNSEYIALKKGRGNQDDLTAELISLRSQFNNIKAKHDLLLRAKSPSDLDLVPLKAKLSSLVFKCQERNSALVQLMKVMRKHGGLEPSLSQHVDKLLSDTALDVYSKTFTTGCGGGSTPGPKCQEHTSEVTTDHLIPVNHGATDMPRTRAGRDNSSDVKSVPTMALKANHPVPCLYGSTSIKVQTSPNHTAEQGLSAKKVPSSPNKPDKSLLDRRAESTPDLSRLSCPSSSPLAGKCHVSTRRRLSSPEKIINLHEQLQQTLWSSYQAPRGHGREEQQGDVKSVPPAVRGSVTMATKETLSAKSTSLFEAVTSRSANMSVCPTTLTDRNLKTQFHSSGLFGSVTSHKVSPGSTEATSLNPSSSVPKTTDRDSVSPASVGFKGRDFTPKTPALGAANASRASNGAFKSTKLDDAALVRSTSCTRSAHSSPERSSKSARGSPETKKHQRPNQEAPSEVCSVKVIRRVGQSSLMIGWERPPLDELGCSNGTFVYGYRVFVDGSFHKSVLSSACTKCVLENVDQSVPVNIGVQTLGANGLCSNKVQVVFESAGSADP